MTKTYRGMAVLIIALRLNRALVPPFPPDLERAIASLAARLETLNRQDQKRKS